MRTSFRAIIATILLLAACGPKTIDLSDLADRNGAQATVAVGKLCLKNNSASQTWKQFVEFSEAWLRQHKAT